MNANLVLGDGGVFFAVNSPERFKVIVMREDEVEAVILPLDTRRTLIGSLSHGFRMDGPELRKAAAQCSHEYFVAAEKSAENDCLQGFIGMNSGSKTQAELDTLVKDLIMKEMRRSA